MYLIFDTETTGLPTRRGAPPSDVGAWPRMVQLAWATYDADGNRVAAQSFLIRPDGFTIPPDAQRVHGISTETAARSGIPVAEALAPFAEAASGASVLVAHNFSYDAGVVGAEFHRLRLANPIPARKHVCTMDESTRYCAIPGPRGFKWPNLEQLHRKLFGKGLGEAHNAEADVESCAKCFFELIRLGVVRPG